MARKTIKIEIPTGSPDDMVTLAEGIKTRHLALGSAATLDNDDVTAMADKAAQAKAKRKQAAELSAQAETLMQGYSANAKTAPIASFEHSSVIRRSQYFDKSREGYKALLRDDITIGTAKTPGPRKKKP